MRGGGAAAALASSTGRGACAIRGSNCLKLGQSGLFSANRREAKQLVSGCRIRSELASLGQRVAKIADQPASFRINFVMRKPSERPTVYGSGCEGVPEAKRLAG